MNPSLLPRLLVLGTAAFAFVLGYSLTHRSGKAGDGEMTSSAPPRTQDSIAASPTAAPSAAFPSALTETSVLSKLRIPVFDDAGEAHPAFAEAFRLSATQRAAMEDARASAEIAELELALKNVEVTAQSERSITMEVPAFPEEQAAIKRELQEKFEEILPKAAATYLSLQRAERRDGHKYRRRYVVEKDPEDGYVMHRTASVIDDREFQATQVGGRALELPENFRQLLAAIGESP